MPVFRWLRHRHAPLALVLLAALIVHGRVIAYDWTGLDDTVLIVDRQAWLAHPASALAAFARGYFGAHDSYYRPLVTASFVLDAQVRGAAPLAFHVTNLVLHAVAALLVYWLGRRLGFCEWWAGAAAIAFATQPALVEAVAWVPGRNDSLLTVLALGACLALEREQARPRLRTKLLHLGLFLAALFTKETAVVLPAIFLAQLRREPRARPVRWLWSGWLAALIIYFAARAAVIERPPGELATRLHTLARELPLLLASLGKLVLPVSLAPIAIGRDTPLWPGVIALCLLIALARAVPARRSVLVFAAVTIVAPMLPGLLISDKLMLENRLYLPAVGLVLLLAEVARTRDGRGVRLATGAIIAAGLVVGVRYESVFREPAVFTAAAVAGAPHGSLAHLQRGIWYQRAERDLASAADEYRAAIAYDTTEPMAHNNLAVVLMSQRRWADAEAELRLELAQHPTTAVAHYNLGLVLRDEGQAGAAAAEWEETLRLDPDHIDAMGELMVAAARAGDETRARHYRDELARHGAKFLESGR